MRFPYVIVRQFSSTVLVFHDFEDVVVFFQGWVWLTKVVPSILRVQWVQIRALSADSDAYGSFLGIYEGARIPYVTVKQRDFLVFRDFDDVVVFSSARYG